MKRKTFALLIVLTLGAAFTLWNIVGSTAPTQSERNASTIENYREKWGIELPKAGYIETIWSSRGWFGDGESIRVFGYANSNSHMLEQGLYLITEANLDFVNNMIQKFIDETLSMQSTSTELKNVFEKHNVEVEIHDYYYHKLDSDR